MEYLFIGGPMDGEHRDIGLQNHQSIVFPVPTSIDLDASGCWTGSLQLLETEPSKNLVYNRQTLKGKDKVFHVYVLSTMTPDEWIARLLDNYNPPPHTEIITRR